MRVQTKLLLPACLALLTAQLAWPAAARDEANPDWPCVSRKVVEISPATIWDGPPLEGLPNWRDDEQIRKLSEYLVSRRIPQEEVEGAIKKFAEGIPEADRDSKLTLLFSAALSRINEERKIVMSGIERFNKRQLSMAKAIEEKGVKLPNQGVPSPDAQVPTGEVDKVSPEQANYNWDVRVFQQRQQNIPIACEIPGLIEERAGIIARSIRSFMKS